MVVLLVTTAPALSPGTPLAHGEAVEWVVADVGQGDGTLLVQGAVALLIDGGGGASTTQRGGRDFATAVWLPLLGERGITRLDAVAVTHGDGDHCGGLIDVASYVAIGEVWASAELADSRCVRELLQLSRATFKGLARGDRRQLGALDFEVLGPSPGDSGKDNDRSLVLALSAFGRRVLFTGDIERRGELELLAQAPEALRCDLLKVAHHGSATSSGQRFLAAASPRMSVISCGVGNRFGHPAPEVVRRLAAAGGPVLRTDTSGQVVVRWRRGRPLEIELPGSPRSVLR
jgi:competence protein ComEC